MDGIRISVISVVMWKLTSVKSMWACIGAGDVAKAQIIKAVQDVISKVYHLRLEARQVVMNRTTSDERLCRRCNEELYGGGGSRRKK